MKTLLTGLTLCFLLSLKSFSASISTITLSCTSCELYHPVQATFTLSGTTYTNPYDPDQITVDAIISIPGGGTETVPCFYYIPVTFSGSNTTENTAAGKWMLRYTPRTSGSYSFQVSVNDGGVTTNSSSVNFNIVSGTENGFVRVNPLNTQFYQFDNGNPYYPNGFNLSWNDGTLATFYHNYLNEMGTNNVTWTRYWLTDFARQALEWTNSATYWGGWYKGLGNYNQSSAALLDSVLSLCNSNNIYLQLVLQHHGQFSTTTDSEWSPKSGQPGNPYNSVNGGPIATPDLFFTDASAKAQTKKLYRYIVARWGYSTNIFAWELFNEVEFTDGTDANIDAWHDEMSKYIKSLDPSKHIITTSCGGDNSTMPLFDDNTAMDVLQFHDYAPAPIENSVYDLGKSLNSSISKPIINGEFGISGDYSSGSQASDNWGDHVRKTFWIGQFSEIPSMFWYWDTYINAKNLFNIYKPLGIFLENTDIVSETGGNYKPVTFASNPAISGTVSAVPGMNWGNSTQQNFIVDGSGNVSGLQNLSSYLAGTSWHPGMGNYASFQVNYISDGTAKINISGSSVSASNPSNAVEIFIDGVSAGTQSFTAAGSFSVSVTSGIHTIKFEMTGNDWVNVSSYQFDPVAMNKCTGYGYTGSTKAYGYVYDQTYGEWADPSTVTSVSGAQIKVGPLNTGTYQLETFDPQSGNSFTSLGTASIFSDGDSVIMDLDFKKDIAFRVTQTSSIPTATISPVSNKNTEAIIVYPNPADNIINIQSGKNIPCTISVRNEMGIEVVTQHANSGSTQLDITNLPSSIYFLQTSDYNGNLIGKIKFIKK